MVELSFPITRDNWSLDVVNILAFLGEHNILAMSQQIGMSWFCFLPRLIPAPQGLLAQRPSRLPDKDNIDVIGPISGRQSSVLPYFANALHGDGAWLPFYTTRVLAIRRHEDRSRANHPVRGRILSPLNVIAMVSCAMSMGLTAWAIALGDGAGLSGVLIMSFTTPILCVGLKWTLRNQFLMANVPQTKDCIVFRTAERHLTVVHCDAAVARLLYWYPQQPRYMLGSYTSRGVSGIAGGIMLVGSLVLFSNATWTIKAALVVAYTVLNLSYWLAAICPSPWSWHLDFVVETQLFDHETYTQSLWTAMWMSQRVDWVLKISAVPDTGIWRDWIEEAEGALHKPRDEFDVEEVMRRLLEAETKR
jgi:hypothetical protein